MISTKELTSEILQDHKFNCDFFLAACKWEHVPNNNHDWEKGQLIQEKPETICPKDIKKYLKQQQQLSLARISLLTATILIFP